MGENQKTNDVGKDVVDAILEHASDGPTVQEVYDSMNEDQQNVVHYLVGLALQENK